MENVCSREKISISISILEDRKDIPGAGRLWIGCGEIAQERRISKAQ
jgi:hypothetical protein